MHAVHRIFSHTIPFSWNNPLRIGWRKSYGVLCDPIITFGTSICSLIGFCGVALISFPMTSAVWALTFSLGALFVLGQATTFAFIAAVARTGRWMDVNLVYWSEMEIEMPRRMAIGWLRYLASEQNRILVESKGNTYSQEFKNLKIQLENFLDDCQVLGLVEKTSRDQSYKMLVAS